VDRVTQTLDKKGVENYMVDIGGEVFVKGKNPKMNRWRIGINKPIEDSLSVNQELQTILEVTDAAMATSGNYRKFYYKDGKRYAHTIDPRIGYPIQHNILSATVIAKDCTTADAYATAFMVMGLEKA
jgi:thiamine biosynthesis lipoprotein